MESYTSGARKQTAFRLGEGLVSAMDRAVLDGRVSNRTELVELAVMDWLGQGDGAVRRPVTSATEKAACHAAVPGPASRPPAEVSRERPLPRKVDRNVDGTPLPSIAEKRWVS